MFANVVSFDGPRSAELIAADDHGGQNRIMPTLAADPEVSANFRGLWVLRRPDGGQIVLTLAEDSETLDRVGMLINTTELLPDEDPALLPGPDRVERYEVVYAYDAKFQEITQPVG